MATCTPVRLSVLQNCFITGTTRVFSSSAGDIQQGCSVAHFLERYNIGPLDTMAR
jgi:hypothetical protein